MRIPAILDSIQPGRSTTWATESGGAMSPVTLCTGSIASTARSRSIAMADRVSSRLSTGPWGAMRIAVRAASDQLIWSVTTGASQAVRRVECRWPARHGYAVHTVLNTLKGPVSRCKWDECGIATNHLEGSKFGNENPRTLRNENDGKASIDLNGTGGSIDALGSEIRISLGRHDRNQSGALDQIGWHDEAVEISW